MMMRSNMITLQIRVKEFNYLSFIFSKGATHTNKADFNMKWLHKAKNGVYNYT